MFSFQEEVGSNSIGASKHLRETHHRLSLPGLDNVRIYLSSAQFRVAKQPRQAIDIHTSGKLNHCEGVACTVESDVFCDASVHRPAGEFHVVPGGILQSFKHALSPIFGKAHEFNGSAIQIEVLQPFGLFLTKDEPISVVKLFNIRPSQLLHV